MRVLLVDDNADIRSALSELLAAAGHDVVGKGVSGVEAISMSGQLQPDLVVIDDQMPALTGMEAIPHIRQVAPTARVLLYSAGVENHGRNDGPDAWVAKGQHPEELLRVIAGLCAPSV